MHASGANAGPAKAYRPAPYALRTITDSFGTVASDTAVIILAPWRMMPWRSTSVPTMKPGTSARNTSGMPYASQHQMKRAALSAESTNSAPPLCTGLLATTPTGRPSSSPKPTITSGANSGFTSKKLSASSRPCEQVVHVERDVLVGRHDVGGQRDAPALRRRRRARSDRQLRGM